jgi:hypothetical protein
MNATNYSRHTKVHYHHYPHPHAQASAHIGHMENTPRNPYPGTNPMPGSAMSEQLPKDLFFTGVSAKHFYFGKYLLSQ